VPPAIDVEMIDDYDMEDEKLPDPDTLTFSLSYGGPMHQ
jgi:hypothetical protein